jgi:hypothetical protein
MEKMYPNYILSMKYMVIAPPSSSGLSADRWLSMHLHVRGLAGATYGEIWGDLGGPGRVSNVSFGELERDHFPKNFEVLNGKIWVNLGFE